MFRTVACPEFIAAGKKKLILVFIIIGSVVV